MTSGGDPGDLLKPIHFSTPPLPSPVLMYLWHVPTKLREGNVFRGVYLSKGIPSLEGAILSRGFCAMNGSTAKGRGGL